MQKPRNRTLYRAYGANDLLLYVGVSVRILTRLEDHARRSAWWLAATHVTFEHLGMVTRDDAEARELEAIRTEHPIFNSTGNVGNPARVRVHESDAARFRPLAAQFVAARAEGGAT